MDDPPPELKKTVHELAGIDPASSQDQLPDLLAKIGAAADELLRKVPNLISQEAVSETQWTEASGKMVPGCVGRCFAPGNSSRRDQTFDYLIVTHPAPGGGVMVQEYRTRRNGKPISKGVAAPDFQGFISAWIILSSPNQVESRFRYLGQQQMNGHNTAVIGFAQIPGLVESPGQIVNDRGSVPMLLQGIAWVDESDFRVIRLRTDLLAPRPEIQLEKQTADIVFGPVKIASVDSVFWLPQAVSLDMEAGGRFFREDHKYSKYRLFRAKSRIVSP
ncbi:MAG: hypothetical protein WB919_05610 [Candidatus Sulfotelmatobacter sp.]